MGCGNSAQTSDPREPQQQQSSQLEQPLAWEGTWLMDQMPPFFRITIAEGKFRGSYAVDLESESITESSETSFKTSTGVGFKLVDGKLVESDGTIYTRCEDGLTAQEMLQQEEKSVRAQCEKAVRAVMPGWADAELCIEYQPGSNQTLILLVTSSTDAQKVIYREQSHGKNFVMSQRPMDELVASGIQNIAFLIEARAQAFGFLPRYYLVEPLQEVVEYLDNARDLFEPQGYTPEVRYLWNYIWLNPTAEPLRFTGNNSPACADTMAAAGRILGELHGFSTDWATNPESVSDLPALAAFPDVAPQGPWWEADIPCPEALYERSRALVPRGGLWSDIVTIHFNASRSNFLYTTDRIALIDWDDVQRGKRMWDILEFALPGGVFHYAPAEARRAFAAAYLKSTGAPFDSDAVDQMLYDCESAAPFMLLCFARW